MATGSPLYLAALTTKLYPGLKIMSSVSIRTAEFCQSTIVLKKEKKKKKPFFISQLLVQNVFYRYFGKWASLIHISLAQKQRDLCFSQQFYCTKWSAVKQWFYFHICYWHFENCCTSEFLTVSLQKKNFPFQVLAVCILHLLV